MFGSVSARCTATATSWRMSRLFFRSALSDCAVIRYPPGWITSPSDPHATTISNGTSIGGEGRPSSRPLMKGSSWKGSADELGEPLGLPVEPSDNPDPPLTRVADPNSTFNQGWAKGAAKFNRLEGCWEDDSTIFFVSTSGGNAKNGDVNSDGYQEGFGQVWAYRPERHGGGTLMLVYESSSATELDSPDNLTVTPRGGLIACEDDASSAIVDTHPLAPGIENVNRLIGITQGGQAFELAVNVLNASELAGVCFSPSGRTLFFNLFLLA